MADIYLAITETPTVVTLTSAVIASSASSTVTVSNFPSATTISGTVTVGNFPAMQSVAINDLNGTIQTGLAAGLNSYVADQGGFIVNLNSPLLAGTAQIGSVTISALPVSLSTTTIGGTARLNVTLSSAATPGSTVPSYANLYGGTDGTLIRAISVDTSGRTVVTGSVSLASLPALVAGTAQIGSVTASISGTVPVSISSVTIGNFPATQPVSLASLPALAAGTAQIGAVTASISGTVPVSISSVTVGNSVTIGSLPAIAGTVTANIAISSTAITSGSFTSLTSATLVPANTARKMATVYNLGAGQLFVNAGASATTLGGGFMVALSSGDFYECDYTTTTLSAIFATAGTASWVSH